MGKAFRSSRTLMLTFWTFSLLDPNARRRLPELMEAEAIRPWPAQEKVVRSFLIKTRTAYATSGCRKTPLNSSN